MYSNTTINKTREAVINYLNDLDDNDTVNAHNIYCREQNSSDDEIFNNDEDFFNTFFEGKVLEAVRAISFGEYNHQDDYVKFNGYGNLESFNSPTDHIDISAIADDILENPENYDVELVETFECNGIMYEGTEEEAREQYEEYKEEDENQLTFAEWVKEHIAEA